VRHRLNRGGNRRLNVIVHRMAQTQARSHPAAPAYLQRRQAEGTTRREALRALKRSLIRAIWQRWKEYQQPGERDKRRETEPELPTVGSPSQMGWVKAA
jgi:hypothetical protein